MKKLRIRFVAAILALTIGIISVWASDVLLSLAISPYQTVFPIVINEVPLTDEPFVEKTAGNVEVRFKRHITIENQNYAEFEIINKNLLPIGYMGYGKNSHCVIAVKRGDKVEQENQCWCGTGLELQTL